MQYAEMKNEMTKDRSLKRFRGELKQYAEMKNEMTKDRSLKRFRGELNMLNK
jgi:hypothetical protein